MSSTGRRHRCRLTAGRPCEGLPLPLLSPSSNQHKQYFVANNSHWVYLLHLLHFMNTARQKSRGNRDSQKTSVIQLPESACLLVGQSQPSKVCKTTYLHACMHALASGTARSQINVYCLGHTEKDFPATMICMELMKTPLLSNLLLPPGIICPADFANDVSQLFQGRDS